MRQMTVRRLISALEKMPAGALVAWQNHDQSAHEIDGLVSSAELAGDAFYAHTDNVRQTEWLAGRQVVVLNP